MTLTIAQSLRRIKKSKGKMAELTARAAGVVSYEAGKPPNFDFRKLRGDIACVREELVTLEAAVARANATTSIEVDGSRMTIAEAIRRLQELKAEMAWLPLLALRCGVEKSYDDIDYDPNTGRQMRKLREVVYASALTEPERVAEIETLRDRFERINDAVERANHVTVVEWHAPASGTATAA